MSSNSTRATPQGGILEGGNPTVYDSKNPIILFVIQAGIILVFCRLLHWPLSKIRQPRVIAEVIGGILLGQSVFGHIPHFQDTIFPAASIPALNLVANLGLVLFLFLVGLETDLRFLMSNWRIAFGVSAAGMVLPFGLGCAISYGLYNQFYDEPGVLPISFGTYLLFIGTAMAITLLSTNVGVIVLSAGVGNDVTGWILLALCVALVNASSGLTALWVLLVCIGYVLFVTLLVRPAFIWFLQRTRSLEKGPSQSVVAVTLLMALVSAFFTQVIGIHAIFGGFLIGLICPHEGGFAIKLTEKVEDLVSTLFLPLYFALSGLQTNLGLLNTGVVWGYVIGITAIAFFAKVAGGTLASRFAGLLWRESFTVGVLMSCKGLVELIVLPRFSASGLLPCLSSWRSSPPLQRPLSPLSSTPTWYQVKVDRWRRGEIDWDEKPLRSSSSGGDTLTASDKLRGRPIHRVLVYLRLDSLPSVCTFVSLLGATTDAKPPAPRVHYSKRDVPDKTASTVEEQPEEAESERKSLQAHGIRLMELTDRLSSTMKVSEVDEYAVWDPVVNTFRAFGQMNNILSEGRVAVVPEHLYADTVVDMSRDVSADFLLLPWSASGSMSERQDLAGTEDSSRLASAPYPAFVSRVVSRVATGVGIFVDRGLKVPNKDRPAPTRASSSWSFRSSRSNAPAVPTAHRNQHILFLFYGGPDDRFGLRFVLQLARNELVTATIVHADVPADSPSSSSATKQGATVSGQDDVPSTRSLPISVQEKESDTVFFASIRDSLPSELSSRVVFRRVSLASTDDASTAVSLAVSTAQEETERAGNDVSHIVAVGRRSVGVEWAVSDASDEAGVDTRTALGVVGEALARRGNGVKASVLVLQAGRTE
ncbi:K homeostasis protein Kha1 [Rasamsonia emersonii CBS 393.64]|uniref:K homeostasis protein Kha1 n=1 Tax=Rasamsonia emersonii (strain ATCC 16479 / CBS 393.64 / IMI 116815) TaxID=1408163 RepID=A0A0F4YVX5_RASE3|nr:K homeostasis protein Kha1 [Rasamsonia emersonii CBS 393.64]KKA21768.1 K homeostasis protein Kha1 [Rasamsonia emersonii CBS 393.64]